MFRRIGWQVLLVGLGFVLTAAVLVYLAATYTTEYRPAPGGTYVESVAGYPQSLNPLLSFYNDADSDVVALTFSGLTRLDMQGQPVLDLAREILVDPGGITYTFRLRDDVIWHDGAPVSADDVLFTIGLLQDPDYPGPPDIAALWQSVQVTKLDDLTVQFVLPEPYAPFIDYTTIGLLPAHLLQGTHAVDLPNLDFNRAPVGTGPFRVTEVRFEEGQIAEVTFKRFPRYYGALPLLENVVLRFYPTPQAAFEAYQSGIVEGVSRISPALLPEAWEQPQLNLYSAQTAEMGMLYFNELISDTLPFADTQVRQALLYGLDRQALVDEVLLGQAVVPQTPFLPGTWAYNTEEVPLYPYTPQRAGELLTAAGWTRAEGAGVLRDAQGNPFTFSLLASNAPQDVALAQAIAAQWAGLGISVTVQAVPPLALSGALESRGYQAALAHLVVPGDPDPYPFWHETQALGGQNYAGFRHRRISEVLEQARMTGDPTQRAQLYLEFQQLFMQEVPALPLYVPIYVYGVDARVQGVQIGPLMYAGDRFRNIASWYVLQRRVVVSSQ